jgi:hypothetical protein
MRKILNLYDATVRGEATERVCSLPDLSSATVRREINGEYSLTAVMPERGSFADMVEIGRAIKCTVNEAGKEQFFIIKRRFRTLSGDMRIYAEHQSYYLSGVICRGVQAGSRRSPVQAFNALPVAATPSITGLSTWTFSYTGGAEIDTPAAPPTPLRTMLLRYLIENYGGEIDFDGFDVEWINQIGSDRGAVYRYGINLTEMEAEDIIDSYASGIYPFWAGNGTVVTIPNRVIDYPGEWPVQFYKPVDMTSMWTTQPSPSELDTLAHQWLNTNTPTGIQLAIRAARAEISTNTPVDLGDTVRIVNTPWGIDQKTRILALDYDALHGIATGIELGSINPGFAGAVKNMK